MELAKNLDYLVRVFYLGDRYYGSQFQPNLPTVQGHLIEAITTWSGEIHSSSNIQFAGRTDRGVHSIGQIAMISIKEHIDIEQINKNLPEDITLWAHCLAPINFKPRYNVLMRHYRYYYDMKEKDININAIQNAIQILVGSHDFALLSKPDTGRGTNTTLVNIIASKYNGYLFLDFYGTRFLWKLIRKIVSLLLGIGTNKYSQETAIDILEFNRTIPSGIEPAPPECLFLIETIIPFRMKISKYAYRRIRKNLTNRIGFLERSFRTISAFTKDIIIS